MFYFFFVFSKSFYEIKELYNAKWLKIFFHNSSNQTYFHNKQEALNSKSFQKFSILGEINNNFLNNNKFEFLLEYPEIIGYNRWTQVANPILQNDYSELGYEGINISWSGEYWGGLALSSVTDSFLDGSIFHSFWFYSIGCYSGWWSSNKFPGPATSSTRYAVSLCYLWIRIDGTNFQPNTKNKKNLIIYLLFIIHYFFIHLK